MAYLSRETVKRLKVWLEQSRITEGAVFRRLIGKAQIGVSLNPGSIAPIFNASGSGSDCRREWSTR